MLTRNGPYKILLADDHTVVRRGIKALLMAQPGIEVLWEASNGTEAVELAKRERPDMVILDLTMPEMDGLQAARAIHAEAPDVKILVLTMHFSKEIARDVLRSGARGYILKSDADTDLLAAVEQIRRGQSFITGQLAETVVHSFVHGETQIPTPENPIPGTSLTMREVEIVRLLCEGYGNKQVAEQLGVSTRTIESHRNHIMHKLRFSNFSELVRFSIRSGLVEA
jgi:two-component system, NarL family, response regulator NreC